MRNELDKKLCEKYPKIFAQRNKSMRETAMCWGFSCGNGWYDLIDTLCHLLQFHIDHNEVPQIEATQVKEKFGTLCFYFSGGNEYLEGMIDMAEFMSGKICEICGHPGKLRGKRSGWLYTSCDKHVKKEV